MARRRDRESPEEKLQARELERGQAQAREQQKGRTAEAGRREIVEDEAAWAEDPEAEIPEEDWLPGEEEVLGAQPDEDPSSMRVERIGRHYLERATGTEKPDYEKPRPGVGLHVERVERDEE